MKSNNTTMCAVASEVVTQHNISCEPHVVRFNNGGPSRLRVDLKLVNVPTCEGLDYRVIAYFVEDGQYKPKSTLKSGAKCIPHFILEQNVNKYWNNSHIAFCLHKHNELKCDFSKDKFYDVVTLQYTEEETNSDCTAPAGKCELTLDVENYCKNLNTADSTHWRPNHGGASPGHSHPQQSNHPADSRPGERAPNCGSDEEPELRFNYIGSGEFGSRVKLSCCVVGQKFDLLSLYQNRTKGNKHVLLKMVQYLKDEEGEITLTLNKTLSVPDTKSKIYCVKQKPDNPPCKRTSKVGIFNKGDYNYDKYRPLVPNITVQPDTDKVKFSRDKPFSLACKGTALLHDQNLTWYIRDRNTSELEVPDASSQQYNQATNESKLTLSLNGSYDSKTLFCAQDGHLVVEHASGRRSVVRYGEAATSRNITLKLQEEIDVVKRGTESVGTAEPQASGPDLGLVCGVVAGLAVLLVVTALVAWRLRRRGAGEGGAPEENEYATIAEVAYAELALKESAGPPKAQDSSPYAQIVGVYNPRK